MISSLPLSPSQHILLLSLLVYCVIKGPIHCIVSLLWHICFSLPSTAAQLPFDFLTPWIVWKYWWEPMLCDNEQISCQSALDLSTFVALYATQAVHGHIQTHLFLLSDTAFPILWVSPRFLLVLHIYPHAVCSSGKPSAEVVCFSLHAVPLAQSFMWGCSTNYLMRAGRPARATAHCTSMKSVCSL